MLGAAPGNPKGDVHGQSYFASSGDFLTFPNLLYYLLTEADKF